MAHQMSAFGGALLVATVLHLSTPGVAGAATLAYLGKNSDTIAFHDVGRPTGEPGQASFVHYRDNPVLGGPNVYAANPVKVGNTWFTYYGGWRDPGQVSYDEVYLASTQDDTLTTGWNAPRTVVGHGYYVHANDPSVVRRDSAWVMALTTFRDHDSCSVLTSADGVAWQALVDRRHEVRFAGASVASCARPSLIWNAAAGRWEMYFDGNVGGVHGQHLAVSTEAVPRQFNYVQRVGDMVDADIRLVGGQYIAAYRPIASSQVWHIDYATSQDGRAFTAGRRLLSENPLDGYDNCGVTNPGWAIDGTTVTALMFGGTAGCGYDTHKLGVALPQAEITLFSGTAVHSHREAVNATVQRVDTHQFGTVDRVVAREHGGAPPIVDQAVTAVRGDTYSIRGRSFTNAPRSAASASSALSDWPAGNAIDGSATTVYSSVAGVRDRVEWLATDLGTTRAVNRVQVTARTGGHGFPIDFSIQSSDDGAGWFDAPAQQYTGFANPGGAPVAFAFHQPVTARYFRLRASRLGPDDFGNFHLQIAEFTPQS